MTVWSSDASSRPATRARARADEELELLAAPLGIERFGQALTGPFQRGSKSGRNPHAAYRFIPLGLRAGEGRADRKKHQSGGPAHRRPGRIPTRETLPVKQAAALSEASLFRCCGHLPAPAVFGDLRLQLRLPLIQPSTLMQNRRLPRVKQFTRGQKKFATVANREHPHAFVRHGIDRAPKLHAILPGR